MSTAHRIVFLIGALLFSGSGLAQTLTVPPGSVGVVYDGPVEKGGRTLRVVFPGAVASGLDAWAAGKTLSATAPVVLDGDLILFDGQGVLTQIPSPGNATVRFWCENDGGARFRPELKVVVPDASLKRKLSLKAPLQNLAAFAAVVPRGAKAPIKLKGVEWRATSDMRALDGDADGDKKPEAVIYTSPDQAKNCDGEPKNNLSIWLLAGSRFDPLRCCGP